jgi:hypothetical protein
MLLVQGKPWSQEFVRDTRICHSERFRPDCRVACCYPAGTLTGTQYRPVMRGPAEPAGALADADHDETCFYLFALEDRVSMNESGSIVLMERYILSHFFIEKRAELIGGEPERVFRF